MSQNFNMVERKEPIFVQFEAAGDVVEGVLLNIDRIEVGERKQATPRFTVRDLEDGQLYSFLGTYDIATKLRRSDIGHVVRVRFEGEDNSVRREGRSMKRFHIAVSEKPFGQAAAAAGIGQKLEDGTFITDEDIPF